MKIFTLFSLVLSLGVVGSPSGDYAAAKERIFNQGHKDKVLKCSALEAGLACRSSTQGERADGEDCCWLTKTLSSGTVMKTCVTEKLAASKTHPTEIAMICDGQVSTADRAKWA